MPKQDVQAHSNFTPARGLKVVDFVCKKMQQQMKHDVSLGGSWFKLFQRYDADSSGMVRKPDQAFALATTPHPLPSQ